MQQALDIAFGDQQAPTFDLLHMREQSLLDPAANGPPRSLKCLTQFLNRVVFFDHASTPEEITRRPEGFGWVAVTTVNRGFRIANAAKFITIKSRASLRLRRFLY